MDPTVHAELDSAAAGTSCPKYSTCCPPYREKLQKCSQSEQTVKSVEEGKLSKRKI